MPKRPRLAGLGHERHPIESQEVIQSERVRADSGGYGLGG